MEQIRGTREHPSASDRQKKPNRNLNANRASDAMRPEKRAL
jgi:hypothetical protein